VNPKEIFDDDRGVVLFTAMMFVMIMSIIGAVAYVITANDATIAVNLETSRKAFTAPMLARSLRLHRFKKI